MKRLLVLADSRDYIRANCYQRQLAATLEKHFRVTMLSARAIRYLPLVRLSSYDGVLSVLRLRTLVKLLAPVARLLKGRPLFIYEQDPWQAFMDDSPYKGAYSSIAAALNVKAFLLTSDWWTKFVRARGFPVRFVRMGMLPEYCDIGPDWDARPIRLGFQGTLHAHRRAFYEKLERMGLSVEVFKSAPYESYLQNLHRMRVYVHTEDAPWSIEGEVMPRNALWIKETEVAARGTFAIRDWEAEADAYAIAELPTVMPYRQVGEVPDIVARIESMSAAERRERMMAAVEAMRRRDDWTTVVRAIEDGSRD